MRLWDEMVWALAGWERKMSINRVQFQKGLSLHGFLEIYGSERQCRDALQRSRWPEGFRCPECGDGAHSRFERGGQQYFQCSRCRHQCTLLSGTLFEATKLPLMKWFLAIYLLTASKTNLAALELMRHLGVCYRTAWRLKQKLMQAMTEQEETRKLSGLVQIDDAYLGGERTGGKPGRGSENKQAFVIAVQTSDDLRPLYAVAEPLPGFSSLAVRAWVDRRLAPGCEVYSDGLAAFRQFAEAGHAHTVLETTGRRAATEASGAIWANIVLANIKRSISGAYHSIRQAKYARRYLAEATYRFNRRFDLEVLVPEFLLALANTKPCAETILRKASNYSAEVRR